MLLRSLANEMPFDVTGTRTIHLDHHDLDSVEAAKSGIVAQIAREKSITY